MAGNKTVNSKGKNTKNEDATGVISKKSKDAESVENTTNNSGDYDAAKFNSIITQLQQLTSSHESLVRKINDYTSTVEMLAGKYDSLLEIVGNQKKCIEKQSKMINEQAKHIELLETSVNKLEQKELSSKLIVRGIPKLVNRDLKETVTPILNKIVCMKPEHLSNVYQLSASSNDNVLGPIVLEFSSQDIRMKILKSKNKFKEDQSTNRIFVHEMLTTENYKLFLQAKELRTKFKYKHIYTGSGKVLARKGDTDKVLWIRSHTHLNNIILEELKQKNAA